MDEWKTWASVLAAVVPIIGILSQAARSPIEQVRYNRWAQILDNASTGWERALAVERMQHYAVEFGVSDRSAPRRRGALIVGIAVTFVSLLLYGLGAAAQPTIGGFAWAFFVMAALIYIVGLYLIVLFPDRERDRVRAEIEALIRADSPDAKAEDTSRASLFRGFFRRGKSDHSD